MATTSISVHVIEGSSQGMAAISVYVPRVSCSCLLPLWETPQDQQVSLARGPIKLLLLP